MVSSSTERALVKHGNISGNHDLYFNHGCSGYKCSFGLRGFAGGRVIFVEVVSLDKIAKLK